MPGHPYKPIITDEDPGIIQITQVQQGNFPGDSLTHCPKGQSPDCLFFVPGASVKHPSFSYSYRGSKQEGGGLKCSLYFVQLAGGEQVVKLNGNG